MGILELYDYSDLGILELLGQKNLGILEIMLTFALNSDKDQYKMFIGDTGLFITLAFWDKDVTENIIYQKLLSDKLSANLGYVYENIVAQMLTASGNKLFYHTWPMEKQQPQL